MARILAKHFTTIFILAGIFFSFFPLYGRADELVHVLADGETLYSVSRKYKIPLESLVRANGIKDADKIRTGTRLVIPDVYEVRKGDTLYGIARKSAVSVPDLLEMNGLRENSVLKPGDALFIPRKNAPAVPAAPAAAKENKPSPPRNAGKEFFWPHPGSQKSLDGKLEGVSFEGKKGDPVVSVASGKVVWVGPYRGFGKVVFVQSDQGYIYVYAGNDEILVSPGDFVRRGQKLGELGLHPYEQKPNLYFIVYKDGKPVRPEDAPRI